MIKFKDLVQYKRDETERAQGGTPRQEAAEIDQELPSVSQLSRQHTPQHAVDPPESERNLQSSQITHP